MSGLLLGTLKYSWYKYCKAPYLIKVPALFNEVTEGSIDQAFCFIPWRVPPYTFLSLQHKDDLLFNTHPHNPSFPLSRCSCFALVLADELLSCSSNLFMLLSQSSSTLPGLVLISLSEEELGVLEDHLTSELSDRARAGHACSPQRLPAHFAAVALRGAGV